MYCIPPIPLNLSLSPVCASLWSLWYLHHPLGIGREYWNSAGVCVSLHPFWLPESTFTGRSFPKERWCSHTGGSHAQVCCCVTRDALYHFLPGLLAGEEGPSSRLVFCYRQHHCPRTALKTLCFYKTFSDLLHNLTLFEVLDLWFVETFLLLYIWLLFQLLLLPPPPPSLEAQ